MRLLRLPAPILLPRFSSPARLVAWIRGLGPYAAVALLLPGGSLIALGMWLTRHGAWSTIHRRRIAVAVATLSAMLIFPVGA
jgi:hypothetical protein